MPFAPGWFSTKNVCPSCVVSSAETMRATMSGPPVAAATTTRTGRFGKAWLQACAATSPARTATTAVKIPAVKILRCIVVLLVEECTVNPQRRRTLLIKRRIKMALMEKVRELIEEPLSGEELAARYRALCE